MIKMLIAKLNNIAAKILRLDAQAIVQIGGSIIVIAIFASLAASYSQTTLLDPKAKQSLLAFSIVFLTFSYFSIKQKSIELQIFLFWHFLFFWPRVFQYEFLADTISLPVPLISEIEFSKGIVLYCLTFTCFAVGMLLPTFSKNQNLEKPNINFDFRILIILSLLVILLSFFEFKFFTLPENSPYTLLATQTREQSSAALIFFTVFGADTFLTLFLALAFHSMTEPEAAKKQIYILVYICSVCIFYAFISALIGSRSGGFKIAILSITIAILINARGKQSLFIGLVFIVFCSSAILFAKIGDDSRVKIKVANQTSSSVESVKNRHIDHNANPNVIRILDRMGLSDYFISSLGSTPPSQCLEEYINIKSQAKTVANFIALGTPFPENLRQTPNKYGLCFRPNDKSNLSSTQYYNSEPWGAFGMLYHFIGELVLPLCLFLGATVSFTLRCLLSNNSLFAWVSFFVFVPHFINGLYFAMGLDHFTVTTITLTLRVVFAASTLFVAVHCIKLAECFIKKSKNFTPW